VSVTWTNFFHQPGLPSVVGATWKDPRDAQFCHTSRDNMRVEERWNGHQRCTPVGMRKDQASHVAVARLDSYGKLVIDFRKRIRP